MVNRDKKIFPRSAKEAEENGKGYAWVKYFSNGENYIVVPKKPDAMNLKVLI